MNAIGKTARQVPRGEMMQSQRDGTIVNEDGSLVVTEEQLARFGNGDPKVGRRELRLLLELDNDNTVWAGPTEYPRNVRIAGPADEQAIHDLLLLDLNENAAHIAPIDSGFDGPAGFESRVVETIRACTRKRGGMCGVIDGPEGGPVAVIILHPVMWWWSKGCYWFEIVNFVHPDHRRSRHVDDLLNFARWCSDATSKQMGTRFYLICGVLGAWRVRAKIALYRRKFRQAGAAFCYPAPPVRGN